MGENSFSYCLIMFDLFVLPEIAKIRTQSTLYVNMYVKPFIC